MIDPEMLRITQVNQAVVAAPGVGMNNGFDTDAPAHYGLQRFLLDVRNDLGEHFSVPFIDSEDNSFATCAATTFAFDSFGSEVGFVHLDLT